MKFLHIADLHFGRLLYGRSLIEDQRHFVRQTLLPAIDSLQPDGLLIAGDIYDRQIASTEAIALFDELIGALCERQCPAVIISGNHDGPERIAVGTRLLAQHGIHIVTTLEGAFRPITLGDAQIFALPYLDNAQIRAWLGDDSLRGAGACMRAVLERMTPLFDPEKKHLLVAHCFAAGSAVSDSESRLFVGGAGDVPTDVFAPFDYAALGHLHAAQRAGDTARYAGSPLKYSVDEAHQKKSMTLVTLGEENTVELLSVTPLHDVKRISGRFDELLERGRCMPDADYAEITLTDDGPVFRPADRLRPYYPNLLSVRNEWFTSRYDHLSEQVMHNRDRTAIFTGFLRDVCGEEPQPGDTELFQEIMQELEESV
ncbi:MAG: exonuclease SbcCD subunit D [Hominenteromicrobium sp.]